MEKKKVGQTPMSTSPFLCAACGGGKDEAKSFGRYPHFPGLCGDCGWVAAETSDEEGYIYLDELKEFIRSRVDDLEIVAYLLGDLGLIEERRSVNTVVETLEEVISKIPKEEEEE